ncbi:hypothetical protein E6H17_07060 [Candidatus Bathyarchaeota archaeon]|nr:MAG: hypothetical protein E6H17_07060 [Candidatus Bathyarchaeota archaeon]
MNYSGEAIPGASIVIMNTFSNEYQFTIRVVTINITSALGSPSWTALPICTPTICAMCASCPLPNAIFIRPGATESKNLALTIPLNVSIQLNYPLYGTAVIQSLIPTICGSSGGLTICPPEEWNDQGQTNSQLMVQMYRTSDRANGYLFPVMSLILVTGAGVFVSAITYVVFRRRVPN